MFRKIAYGLLLVLGLYLALAFTLTFWPAPRFQHPPRARPKVAGADLAYQQRSFLMRDGVHLFAREIGGSAPTTVLLVHGVGADGSELVRPAQLLHEASGARIVVLDLRGHGRSGGRPWSVNHAGQYDEDINDVLISLRKEVPAGRLVLAGHSMGGGIALRHAFSTTAPVDGYLLIAPLLGSAAPTSLSSASATAGAGFAIFLTPRLFGVLLFNLIGVHAFNQLPVLELNQPDMPAYGFDALRSMQPNAPNDYRAALEAIHVPMLLVAGSRDEAFNAAAYPNVVHTYGQGDVMIAPGATHNSVLIDPEAVRTMGQWLRGGSAPWQSVELLTSEIKENTSCRTEKSVP